MILNYLKNPKMSIKLILVVVIQLAIFSKLADGKKAYVIELQTFEPFSNTEKEYFDPGTLRIIRKGRNTFAITGDFEFFKNFGDEMMVSYVTYKKGIDQNYKEIMKGADGLCKMILGSSKSAYEKISEVSNIPNPAVCPFPKGKYTINNFQVDDDFMPMIIPAGDYIVKVSFFIGDDILFGYKVTANVK